MERQRYKRDIHTDTQTHSQTERKRFREANT